MATITATSSRIGTREFNFGSFDERRQMEEGKNGHFQACSHGVDVARPRQAWAGPCRARGDVRGWYALLRIINFKMLPFLHSAVSERPWEVMKQSK